MPHTPHNHTHTHTPIRTLFPIQSHNPNRKVFVCARCSFWGRQIRWGSTDNNAFSALFIVTDDSIMWFDPFSRFINLVMAIIHSSIVEWFSMCARSTYPLSDSFENSQASRQACIQIYLNATYWHTYSYTHITPNRTNFTQLFIFLISIDESNKNIEQYRRENWIRTDTVLPSKNQ